MNNGRNTIRGKGEDANFSFVHIERPGATVDQRVRRQVKSHVSRLQHRQERERQFAVKRSKDLDKSSGATSSSTRDSFKSSETVASITRDSSDSSVDSQTVNSQNVDSQNVDPQTTHEGNNLEEQSALERSFSRGSIAFRTIALKDTENQVGKNIAGLRLDISNVMSFYRMISIIQAQDFDAQCGEIMPGVISWEKFYSYIFTDPMLLTVAILLKIRHQFEVFGRDSSPRSPDGARIINIERFLLRSINEALQDPVRSISDQMLVTVILYAAYEIKHGTGERYHIHMRGLLQILNLRGGLREVGRQDPYTERLLLWQDANTAQLAGVDSYLGRLDNNLGTSSLPRSNSQIYRDHFTSVATPRILAY